MLFKNKFDDMNEYIKYANSVEHLEDGRLPVYFYQGEGSNCGILVKSGAHLDVYIYGQAERKLSGKVKADEKIYLNFKNGTHLVDFDLAKGIALNGSISGGSWIPIPPKSVENCLFITKKGEYRKTWRQNAVTDLIYILNYYTWSGLNGSPTQTGIEAVIYSIISELGLDYPTKHELETTVRSWEKIFSGLNLPTEPDIKDSSTDSLINLYETFEWAATTPEEKEDDKENSIILYGEKFDAKMTDIIKSGEIPKHSHCRVENDMVVLQKQIVSILATYGRLYIRVLEEKDIDVVERTFSFFPKDDLVVYNNVKEYIDQQNLARGDK